MPQSFTEPRDQGIQTNNRIRVVIGEDTFLMLEALERIVSGFDYIDAVAFCGDRDSLVAAIEREQPDAVLTDIRMPPTGTDEGIQVARELRLTNPEIGVVILSQFADPSYVLDFLDSGSAGRAYLLKERVSDPQQLVAAIEAVVDGGSVIDPKVVEVLVHARSAGTNSPLSALTRREHDVLAELAQGKSNAAIAQSLVLTKRAVEKHINAIFTKLELESPDDVSRRVKAALLFLASGNSSSSG
ncbi:MAG TPA: response regulator transcription factor [Solirubrobacteraceae bacterium]|nr:response regulator transcription factor [Solirubrobacteraceae bacterium]